MENRNMPFFGRDGTKATVRISQHQKGIRLYLSQKRIDLDQNIPYRLRGRLASRVEEMIRLAYLQILEKYLVQLVIVILARMHKDMFDRRGLIERGHHPRKADDFGPSTHDSHHFEFFHYSVL
jgi:hypothetical protein